MTAIEKLPSLRGPNRWICGERMQRRVQHYGYTFNYETRTWDASAATDPIPSFLAGLVRPPSPPLAASIALFRGVLQASWWTCESPTFPFYPPFPRYFVSCCRSIASRSCRASRAWSQTR